MRKENKIWSELLRSFFSWICFIMLQDMSLESLVSIIVSTLTKLFDIKLKNSENQEAHSSNTWKYSGLTQVQLKIKKEVSESYWSTGLVKERCFVRNQHCHRYQILWQIRVLTSNWIFHLSSSIKHFITLPYRSVTHILQPTWIAKI